MRRIFFVLATEIEAKEILSIFLDSKEEYICGLKVNLKQVSQELEIGVSVLGVAKVSFGIGTQIIIDNFKPEKIYSLGFCGVIFDEAPILSPVIGIGSFQYDVFSSNGDNKDYSAPEYRRLNNYSAENCIIQEVRSVLAEMNPLELIIATGDNFLSDRNLIKGNHRQMAVDQETAAFYQSCYFAGIKGIAIKVITDRCDDNAYISYNELIVKAQVIILKICQKLVKHNLDVNSWKPGDDI